MHGRKTKFTFTAKLSEIDATFIKTVIIIPEAVVNQLPKGRVRVEGTLNGAPFALAVQHMKEGARYFSVSAPLRKAARIRVGDSLKVSFKLVDPDKLDVPEELEALLAQDEKAKEVWDQFTMGYQRSLIHYITSVKNVDSRIKRSIELLEKAKARQLHGQQRKK